MFHDGSYYMGGMHGLWWIFWVVLIGLVVLYGRGRPGEGRRRPRETPLEVLRRRLANGEVSPEEYEKRKALVDRDGAKP
ncbi:MAG: SHOCT domain-containing protein [Casimicrobiaceae bacterium]